jgi:hypothetical protein
MSQQEKLEERKIRFSTPDNWTLIEHIGRMQSTNPLRSIKELVDNAIDAFARDPTYAPPEGKIVRVEIGKNGGSDHIKVVDNALGWECNTASGNPDFEYSVEHIGASIKKILDQYRKARDEGLAIGQYALGLLSFWALGNRLTVFSRCCLPDRRVGNCSRMVWLRYNREAGITDNVESPPELAKNSGCIVIIDELEKARMGLVTGTSLQKYLGRACRSSLMKTGVTLEVHDRGKKFTVRPMKYEGTHFLIEKYHTKGAFGDIELEIYLFPPAVETDEFKVPIFARSARVYDDITQIEELNVYPWNSKKVYGQVNYPWGKIAPSRNAFENDEFLGAFIDAMKEVTEKLSKQIEEIETRRRKWQRKKFYETFEKTWQEILNKLPEEWQRKKEGQKKKIEKEEKKEIESGPIYRLEISPQDTQVQCRSVQPFTVKAFDRNENPVTDPEMIYYWKVEPVGVGLLTRDQYRTCIFQAGKKEGTIATITATAFQYLEESGKEKTVAKTASTNIWIVSQLPVKPPSPPHGDKPPIYDEYPLGDEIHSKFVSSMNMVQINNQHKDFKAAEERGDEALYRYINYCYCKEMAVDRWKDLTSDPHELSERIADLLAISDLAFDWKSLAQKRRGRLPRSQLKQ